MAFVATCLMLVVCSPRQNSATQFGTCMPTMRAGVEKACTQVKAFGQCRKVKSAY